MRKDPQLLIDDFGSTHPNALLLAEVVSIAVRVEPELLRMARLTLVPEANAGDEADLWFSPLVQVRNILGFVFYPEVAQILRDRLANKIELLNYTWDKLFTKVHENISPALYVEEEITWRALKNPSDPEIENLLKRTLAAIVQENDDNGISHWILRALPNLPNHVLQLEITQLLKWVALLRLGDDSLFSVEDPAISESMPEWVSHLIPSYLGTFKIGVRFVEDGMEFGNLDSLKDAETLELPATNPLLMDISWIKDSNQRQSKLIWFKYNETNYLRLDVDEVELKTLSGDKYKLYKLIYLNPIYRALKCTISSFKDIYERFDSDVANSISEEFEEGLKNKVYENENKFVQLMKDNLEFLNDLLIQEVKYNAIEKDLTNYIAVVKELTDIIESNKVLQIPKKQEELCYFARKLRPANSIYRALRFTAVNFAEMADEFENKTGKKISENFEKAVNNEVYEDENEFINFIKENFGLFRTFAGEIRDLGTKETLHDYTTAVRRLEEVIESGNAHIIAEKQEEVCSAAKQLEIHLSVNTKYDDPINNPIYRALKYSSTSFKKIAEEFKNDRAFDISLSFKKAIGEKLYEKEKDFVKFMDSMQKPIEAFAGEIRERAEKGGFTDFENSLETLKNTIAEGIPLKIATQQDEVCFYALELKLTVNDPMYKALNCTALNFSKVAELFKSETAHNISFIFEKAVESRVYEDRDKFVKFMGENLELLRALSKELKIKASESSLNDYSLSVEELAKSIDLNDAPEIAARQQDVCSRAQNLAFSDDPINPINNPMYRALKCSVRSFKKVEEEFKNDKSLGISLLFKKAVRDKLYENENDFLDFMRKILGQINVFKEEIKTQTEEGSFKDFDGALEDLQKAIDGDTPLKVAAQQEEVCSATRGLKIYLLSDYPGYFYRALRCTAANFAKAADLFENKTAKAISEKFGIALNKKIHEDDEFRNLMEENFVLFETFAEEIKDLATKETLTKYSSSVEKLAFAIRSGEALKIATRQQKVCSAARELEIHLLP